MSTVTGPVTLREALAELRRPFAAESVKFKVQAGGKTAEQKALVVCYIDARHVIERLNHVVAGDWHDAYTPVGKSLVCNLTVCGVTRQDIGVMEDDAQGGPKAVYSDALKRAAVKFGVGVSLYATPKMFVNGDGLIRNQAGKPVGIKDIALAKLRADYTKWLGQAAPVFGDPLDHGDSAGVGDHETDHSVPEGVDPETGEITTPMTTTDHVVAWLERMSTEQAMEMTTLLARAGVTVSIGRGARKVAEVLVAEFGQTAATYELLAAAAERRAAEQRDENEPVNF